MWNYHSDVLVLVLIRLPPKSLGRCKIVSRSWNVLISSSEFIRYHLEYQSSIQKKLYRLLPGVAHHLDPSYETHLAEYSINGENLLGCEIQRLYNPYERHAPGMMSMLVGSCNGLICQTLSKVSNTKRLSIYGEYEISLCNPLTKSTWVLPKSLLSLNDDLLCGRRRRKRRIVVFYGFGYDDVHDTYKVFLASGPPHNTYKYKNGPENPPDANYEYQVYSLRSNKWIMVSSDHLDYFLHDYYVNCLNWHLDGVLINYALHWIMYNPYGPNHKKNKNYILAFDLRADKLNILTLPEAADEYDDILLTELNGCLLISDKTYFSSDPESIHDMWVMKDYGLKDSWTRIRICNSPYTLSVITPVALLEDSRRLIYHDTRCCNSEGMILLTYDTESHQVEEFPTPPSDQLFHCPELFQFVASLVHPHPPSSGDENIFTTVNKRMAHSPRKNLRKSSEAPSNDK